jgi:formylglycine-generating enzyme required for sulfatase activity
VQVEEMRDAMAALGEALTPEQRAFLDPGFRADWLLRRDLAAWEQAGRPDDRLWGDDRFLGFVPEDRAEPEADDEPGDDAAPAAAGAPQPPEPPLLPEPATAEQWQAQRERRRFLSRSFEQVLADHAGRPMRRTRCAEGLARLGDPRFDPLHWHLPDDDMLGFREVPAGRFLMGTPPAQARWDELYHPREGVPEHPVALRTFYLARWPVTVGQFRAYLTAADVRERWPIDAWDQHWRTALPTMPVVYVSCAQASAYIDWLAQQMRTQAGRRVERLEARIDGAPEGQAAYRFWKAIAERAVNPGLPSEAEWEKAARGGEDRADAHGRVYPWGDDFDATRANGSDTRIGGACPVGCFPAGRSPVACEDLSGNVWEWTRSLWDRQEDTPDFPYPYDPDDAEREDRQAPGDRRRVLRGGSFGDSSYNLRCAVRYSSNPGLRLYYVGFRVAWSPYL